MRVELGPVSSASAQAWIAYATDMLVVLRTLPEPALAPRVLDAFASLIDEWRPIAQGAKPFRWSTEERPERAQYLINALYVAGTVVEHEIASGRARLRPATADEFHIVLVREVLDALEHESEADAHFVQEMATFGASHAAIEPENLAPHPSAAGTDTQNYRAALASGLPSEHHALASDWLVRSCPPFGLSSSRSRRR